MLYTMRILKGCIIGLLCLLCICCGTTYTLTRNFDYRFTERYKIDSVCVVERIPTDMSLWKNNAVIADNEEQTILINQYFYIIDRDSIEITYTFTDLDSLYRLKKRTLEKHK